jgi:WD40 repeat protein
MSRSHPTPPEFAAALEQLLALGDSVAVEAELARIEAENPELARGLRARLQILESVRTLPPGGSERVGQLLAEILEPSDSEERRAELLGEVAQDSLGLSPRFIELGELARGGMSEIVRVWDSALKRDLALKRLAPMGDSEREATATQVRRFIDEARITGSLEHPSIVPVHHFGLDAGGRLYFTMQRVPGPTFAEVIDLVRRGADGWTMPRAVRALLAVCEAVAFAHDQRVIHRDIKPSNIKVGRFGEVYLLDWGVARRLEDPEELDPEDAEADGIEDDLRTASGVVLGTPAFMAPEQARGTTPPSPRTDVYSLGAVLYHLLGGQPPYGRGKSADDSTQSTTLDRVLEGPPASLAASAPDADPELVSICERAMAREPSARYADARELAADLNAWVDGRVVRAHATGALAEFGKWTRRNRLAAGSLGAILAGAVVASVWMARSNEQLRTARRDADDGRALALEARNNANMIAAASAADSGELLMAQRMLDATPGKRGTWEWDHLALRVDSSERVIAELGTPIHAALSTPDGEHQIVACDDGTVRWIDPVAGSTSRVAHVSSSAATALAIPRAAAWLFVGRGDGGIDVFTLDGDRLHASDSGVDGVVALAASDDGRLLIAGHGDRKRRYRGWLNQGGSLVPLWDRYGRASAVTLLPSSMLALVGQPTWGRNSESIAALDGLRGWRLGTLGTQGERLYDIELSEDATHFATLSWDGTLSLRRLGAPEPLWSVEHKGPDVRPFPGSHVAFEPGGRRLASGGWDRSVHLWDAVNGAHLGQRFGHQDRVTHVGFLAPGRVLSTSLDGTLRSWDWDGEVGMRRISHPHWIYDIAYSPSGEQLATGCRDGGLRVYDRRTGRALHECPSMQPSGCYSIDWSDDGRWLVSAETHYPPEYSLWRGFYLRDGQTLEPIAIHRNLPSSVLELDLVPDASAVVLALHNGTLEVREPRSGALLRTIEGHAHPRVNSVDVSPDGRRVASASFDGTVRVWDLQSGECELVFDAHGLPVRAARWSPDGRRIASCGAGWDHTVRTSVLLWDAHTGRIEQELTGHEMGVLDVAWHPDGSRLASADENGRVRVWDTRTGACVLWMRDNEAWIGSLEWSPDGAELSSGGSDRILRIWSRRKSGPER